MPCSTPKVKRHIFSVNVSQARNHDEGDAGSDCYEFHAGFMFSLIIDSEVEGYVCLRNVG
jgi:hypothetical protein